MSLTIDVRSVDRPSLPCTASVDREPRRPCGRRAPGRRGLALTFGTLLSSQGASAHHLRPSDRSRGNSQNISTGPRPVKHSGVRKLPGPAARRACLARPAGVSAPGSPVAALAVLTEHTQTPEQASTRHWVSSCTAALLDVGRALRYARAPALPCHPLRSHRFRHGLLATPMARLPRRSTT